MNRSASLAFACVVAIGCVARADDNTPHITWSRDTLFAHAELTFALDNELEDTATVARPFHVRAANGVTFVSDLGSDRVAVIDSAGHVQRWIGAPGRGPGELRGVSHLAAFEGRVFVGEALNGRVSEFTIDGRFVQIHQSPFAAGSIAVTSDGALAVARSATHFATRLNSASAPTPALRRSQSAVRRSRVRWGALPGHDLIAADSTRAWVFDQGNGDVCRFDQPHLRGLCAPLPRQLIERLRRYRDERVRVLERATGLNVDAAPLAKDMVRIGSLLAMLLPLPELPVVLIDLVDGALTPVVLRSDSLPTWARRATSFAWDGRSFVLVSDYGIGRLYVSARPPR